MEGTLPITEENLRRLYVDECLSIRECAKRFGMPTHGGIGWRLKRWGIKARHSKFQKGNQHAVGRQPWLGRKHTADSRKKMSESAKGKVLSKEHRANLSNALRGRRIPSRQLNLHKKRYGRLTVYHKLSIRRCGRVLWFCVCDCGNVKLAISSDLQGGKVKSCGCLRYPKGKDNPNWKGGKIAVECAYCGKPSKVYKSRAKHYNKQFCDDECRGLWMSKNLRGKDNPRYKPKVSAACAWCGRKKRVHQSRYDMYDRLFCNAGCQGKWMSANLGGKNNPRWRGGKSLEPYCPIWNFKDFRNGILDRDNRKCQNPHCSGEIDKLSLHHIDYDKKNCHPDNLITVCVSCNSRANVDRDWHTAFYQALMHRSSKLIQPNRSI